MADTIRLQSTQDPSVVIEGPAGKAFDPRQWQPVGTAPAAPVSKPPATAPPLIFTGGMNPVASAIAQDPTGQVGRGAAEPIGDVIKSAPAAALPTAGVVAGGAVGGPGGAVLGGMAGEAVNQGLGITEPSGTTVLLNGLLPGVGRLLGQISNGASRWAGARMPGASSTLHEMAAEQLGKIPGAIQPTATAESLYKIVDGFSPSIEMPNLRAAAAKLLTKEQQAAAGLKLPGVAGAAESLDTMAQATGGMPFQDIRVNLRRVGDKVRDTAAAGGEEYGAYKTLWRSMMDDLEAAAAAGNPAEPAVQALKAANGAFKREMAASDLADLFSIKGGGISPRPDGAGVQVNFGKIVRAIEKSDDLRRSLPKDEYDKLLSDVREMWSRTPNLPAVAGTDAGSKMRNKSIALGTGAGAALGFSFGNTTLGASVGAAVGAAGPDILGKLMVSEGGRRFLHGVLTGTGGVINPETMSILATAVGNTPPARDTAAKLGDLGRQYLTENP